MKAPISKVVQGPADLLRLAGMPESPTDPLWELFAMLHKLPESQGAELMGALRVGALNEGLGFCFELKAYRKNQRFALFVLRLLQNGLTERGLTVVPGPWLGPKFPGMKTRAYCLVVQGEVEVQPRLHRGPTPEA